jgi:outer membrane immunogenic protein
MAGAVAAPGLAADLPAAVNKAAPATLPVTPFSWAGTFAGVNVSGAWGKFNFDPATTSNLTGLVTDGGSTGLTDDRIIGGFQIGHNWQFGSWVLGIEHEFQFSNLQQTLTVANPAGGLLPGDSFTAKVDDLNATRAIGWAWDRTLLFATAGLQTGSWTALQAIAHAPADRRPSRSPITTNFMSATPLAGVSTTPSPTRSVSASSIAISISARRPTISAR